MNATKTARRSDIQDVESPSLPELIDVDRIDPHPDNPRQDFPFDELVALSGSLTALHLLAPIQVQPAEGGRFRLLSGERRWRAAKLVSWEKIPAFVRRNLTPYQAISILAEDNLQHRELNPIERARALALLVKPMHDGGAGMTPQQVAERYGKDVSWAKNLLRLLKLPPVWQEEVRAGSINFTQARTLAGYADRPEVLAAAAADRAANPADWQTVESYEANLAAVAERLGALATIKPRGPGRKAKGPSLAVPERLAGPDDDEEDDEDVDEGTKDSAAAAGEDAPVLALRRLPAPNLPWLLQCVERMQNPGELQQLQEAVALRLLLLRDRRKAPATA